MQFTSINKLLANSHETVTVQFSKTSVELKTN